MPIGFKDYMSVDNKPGEDDQIKYNAQKRKRYDEAKSKMVCKDCGDEFGKPTTNCKHDCSDPNGKNWVKEYSEKTKCPECDGEGCDHCEGKGYHMSEMDKNMYKKQKSKSQNTSFKGVRDRLK